MNEHLRNMIQIIAITSPHCSNQFYFWVTWRLGEKIGCITTDYSRLSSGRGRERNVSYCKHARKCGDIRKQASEKSNGKAFMGNKKWQVFSLLRCRYLLQLIGQETSKVFLPFCSHVSLVILRFAKETWNFFSLMMPFVSQVPLNNALDEAAGALVKAWELYGSERFSEVLFVLSLAVQVLWLLCFNSFFLFISMKCCYHVCHCTWWSQYLRPKDAGISRKREVTKGCMDLLFFLLKRHEGNCRK